MKKVILSFAIACALSVAGTSSVQADNIFREFGRDVKHAGKQAGRTGKQVGKSIGRTGKKVGKEIGKAAKDIFVH
jgi:predicted small secreted protein